jgi:hypothetical protein
MKWVLIGSVITLAVSTLIWFSSQDLKPKGASASLGLAVGPSSSSMGAKYVNPELLRPGYRYQYGLINSLTRKGRMFEMRFDPAFWLSGVTARRASLEDHPGDPGGDYYVLDEGHRLVTYLVPASARVTIVTRLPYSERSTVSELAQLVKGRNPKHRRWLNMHYGFWIRLVGDTVRSLDQQYRP